MSPIPRVGISVEQGALRPVVDSSTSGPGRAAESSRPRAIVFTPSPLLTVTVEANAAGGAEIHLHAGGQGVWVARMLVTLGINARLCGPFGGEAGAVIKGLVERDGIAVIASSATDNGSYLHDRRAGRREPVADCPPPALSRHQLDELYNHALVEGAEADVVVLTGPDGDRLLPADTYRRLSSDLKSAGTPVVADLSGECLTAATAGGLHVAKVSHEDLVRDQQAPTEDRAGILRAARNLREAGAANVIVTRADQPALVLAGDRLLEIQAPRFEAFDHRGAGDSLTAGVAAGIARGNDLEHALRLGAAAGTLNITRHGLATGERDLIERLAAHVEIRQVSE